MPKNAALLILVSFGLTGLAGCCEKQAVPSAGIQPAAVSEAAADNPDGVTVYYFHNTRRCRTCLGIQKTIEQTIAEDFIEETGSGRLRYLAINLDEPQNRHFTTDFALSFSTMVMVRYQDEKAVKWENFDKVWEYARDPQALADYTMAGVRRFLDEGGSR